MISQQKYSYDLIAKQLQTSKSRKSLAIASYFVNRSD